ncbi:CPK1, partial [Symbiodinium sp. KB8]
RDSDLPASAGIRERFPTHELWALMGQASEEFQKANPSGATPGPWNYWVLPLLQEASAPETTLIDCVGFVAACAESTVLVSSGALRSPGLLNALAALSRTATADELSRFADAVGSRVYLLGKPWGQAEDDLDKLPAEDSTPAASGGYVVANDAG